MKLIEKLLEIDKEDKKLKLINLLMSSERYWIIPEIVKNTGLSYYCLINYLRTLVKLEIIEEKNNTWTTGKFGNARRTGKKYRLNNFSDTIKLLRSSVA